jgi:hypothetical protein
VVLPHETGTDSQRGTDAAEAAASVRKARSWKA